MSRTIRTLFCALCLLAGGLAAAPASAQPGPLPIDALSARLPMFRMVIVKGAGPTAAEALENALNILRADYTILRYTEISSGCPEILLPPIADEDDIPDEPEVEVICWSEVRALVLVKAAITSP